VLTNWWLEVETDEIDNTSFESEFYQGRIDH